VKKGKRRWKQDLQVNKRKSRKIQRLRVVLRRHQSPRNLLRRVARPLR
jgi:hypothetical protein